MTNQGATAPFFYKKRAGALWVAGHKKLALFSVSVPRFALAPPMRLKWEYYVVQLRAIAWLLYICNLAFAAV